jgi:hypothetical protein
MQPRLVLQGVFGQWCCHVQPAQPWLDCISCAVEAKGPLRLHVKDFREFQAWVYNGIQHYATNLWQRYHGQWTERGCI